MRADKTLSNLCKSIQLVEEVGVRVRQGGLWELILLAMCLRNSGRGFSTFFICIALNGCYSKLVNATLQIKAENLCFTPNPFFWCTEAKRRSYGSTLVNTELLSGHVHNAPGQL